MKPTGTKIDVKFTGIFRQYNAEILKDGDRYYLKMHCLCDGTMIFLEQMIEILRNIEAEEFEHTGCTDIETETSDRPDLAPEDKPWMSCLFEAWGTLPKTFGLLLEAAAPKALGLLLEAAAKETK